MCLLRFNLVYYSIISNVLPLKSVYKMVLCEYKHFSTTANDFLLCLKNFIVISILYTTLYERLNNQNVPPIRFHNWHDSSQSKCVFLVSLNEREISKDFLRHKRTY